MSVISFGALAPAFRPLWWGSIPLLDSVWGVCTLLTYFQWICSFYYLALITMVVPFSAVPYALIWLISTTSATLFPKMSCPSGWQGERQELGLLAEVQGFAGREGRSGLQMSWRRWLQCPCPPLKNNNILIRYTWHLKSCTYFMYTTQWVWGVHPWNHHHHEGCKFIHHLSPP